MRVAGSIAAALAVALGLFALMQHLVAPRPPAPIAPAPLDVVSFVRESAPEPVPATRRRRPPPPPPPRSPPPPLPARDAPPEPPAAPALAVAAPRLPVRVAGGDTPLFGAMAVPGSAARGEVIPIVRFAPRYPREAQLRGIEGWVRVRFTVTADGSVASATVVEAQPPRVFDREALRAVARWKFQPRVVDGVAVAREAEQVIEFTLGED